MQPHPFSLPSFAQPRAGRKSSEAGLSFPLCCSSRALPGRATRPVPQHLPLSPWQCQGVLINIRSPVMDAAAGKHLDQQITGSPVQALHTQELRTCIGKLLGKNTGVPSRWEAHHQTSYSLTQNTRREGRTSVRKICRPRALALNLMEPQPLPSLCTFLPASRAQCTAHHRC